jgi:hypothetical protein
MVRSLPRGAPVAAAGQQHDERYAGSQPDGSRNCYIHFRSPFRISAKRWNYADRERSAVPLPLRTPGLAAFEEKKHQQTGQKPDNYLNPCARDIHRL